MKVAELEGTLLDYWVARAEGYKVDISFERGLNENLCVFISGELTDWAPSTDWAQGGPIIEREHIEIRLHGKEPFARIYGEPQRLGEFGSTALIAAMRAYVASKYGEEVPDE